MDINKFVEFRNKSVENISKVIVGKEQVIEHIIVSFIVSGHVLLEDVPGLGKTKMCKALSKTMNCSFKRIQFTPDLLPSDLTGIYFYNQGTKEFEFRKGPILSEVVLADEINRATPRTQSALLECMEEGQVTVEGNTIELGKPFFVIATENPVEQFGTFPLPEAQLDRFFMRLSIGYPEYDEEIKIINRFIEEEPLEKLNSVISLEEISYVQKNYNKIYISEDIKKYIVDLVRATRNHKEIELGCSPRATLNLMKGCQGLAAINGRDYVILEDIKDLAVPIMAHRVIVKNDMSNSRNKSEKVIENILNTVETPIERS